MLSRRDAAKLLAVSLLAAGLQGHTPYAQWTIYRKRNLFIVAARSDERATALAQTVAEKLAAGLPDSRARFTRAADVVRLASLLKTGQLDVAVIGGEEAEPMQRGSGAFATVGPVSLRLLAGLGDHLLVTVGTFKARHAFLLARALDAVDDEAARPRPATTQTTTLPYHPGALAYQRGEPLPSDEGGLDAEPHAHPH